MIDKIIVTGCSYSTGIEMIDNDQKIFYLTLKDRRSYIWKWYKENYPTESKGLSIEQVDKLSNQKFHDLEREHSWPTLLEKETGIPVINLSVIGASIGRTLIEFSNYCKDNKVSDQTVAIHQLPFFGRFYMRFLDHRTNVLPRDFDEDFEILGYDKKYFKKDIEKLKNNYRQIIKKDLTSNYIEKHYYSCLKRIKRISEKNQIKSFFITQKDMELENVIIKDFEVFKEKYKKGSGGHPIDPNFNKDLVEIIKTRLSV